MTTKTWQRARACTGSSTCVDVSFESDYVYFRDGKRVVDVSEQEIIAVPLAQYEIIKEQISNGDSTIGTPALTIRLSDRGAASFISPKLGTTLEFDRTEWSTFSAAVTRDDFRPIDKIARD